MAYVRRLSIIICVLAITLVAAWFFIKNRANDMIRAHVEDRFNSHYVKSGIQVSVGSARLIEDQAIVLYDLSFKRRGGPSAGRKIVHVGEVILACKVQLHELLTTKPQVTHVRVRRLKFFAHRDREGSWALERLWPLPPMGNTVPCFPVIIKDSSLEIRDARNRFANPFKLTEINLAITPTRAEAGKGGQPSPVARSTETLQVHGSMLGNFVKQIKIDGSIDTTSLAWSLRGKAQDFQISQQLRDSLPSELGDSLARLSSLRANLTLDFTAAGNRQAGSPIEFAVNGKLTNGRIDDPRLPYPLTDMQADVSCDNRGIRVENMTARSGLGTIDLSCRLDGFDSNSPIQLDASARRLLLNDDVKSALPEPIQELWDKYSPAGSVDAKFRLTSDAQGWKPDLTMQCQNVSFAFYKFPYRFENCHGTVHWNDRVCTMDLVAQAGGRRVRFDGSFVNPGKDYTGTLTLSVDGPIPIDEKSLDALDPRWRAAVLPLDPRGQITFAGTFTRQDPDGPLIPHLKIGFQNCSMTYEPFPYPIDRISGNLELVDRQWTFRNIKGYNDSGYFTCDGSFSPRGRGNMLDLSIVGTDIPLEEELRLALKAKNPQAARLWSDLRPRGSINHVRVNLSYDTHTDHLKMDVQAQKWQRQGEIEGRSVSIHPRWFPYRLDDVVGMVQYRDGKILLHNISGIHDKTQWFLKGSGEYGENDWTISIDELRARRLQIDDDLIGALPEKFGNALLQLKLDGLVSINGAVTFFGDRLLQRPTRAHWDLSIDVENGDVDCGVKLSHIYGGIEHLTGQFDGRHFQSRGNLKIDSVMYKGVQLTQVTGPIWLDDSRAIFGSWAQPADYRGAPKHITARLFGGVLEGDAALTLSGDWPFHLQATLKDGDLTTLSRELAPTKQDLSGTALAGIRLKGDGKGPQTFDGNGYVRIANAQIYEIPVLVAMLKLLSIKEPNRTAFTTSSMDFHIRGDYLYFDRIDLSGDAISLRGIGSVNLNRDIDFTFYTMIGRSDVTIPVISPLLGLAGRQFMRIHIDGKLDEPNRPTREVLPALNDTLRALLYPELAQRPRRRVRDNSNDDSYPR